MILSQYVQTALDHLGNREFTRKDYIQLHKGISTATASRDIASAVQEGRLKKDGDKSRARYKR